MHQKRNKKKENQKLMEIQEIIMEGIKVQGERNSNRVNSSNN